MERTFASPCWCPRHAGLVIPQKCGRIPLMTKLERFRRLKQLEAEAWAPVSSVKPIPFGTDPIPTPVTALRRWARRRKAVDRAERLFVPR